MQTITAEVTRSEVLDHVAAETGLAAEYEIGTTTKATGKTPAVFNQLAGRDASCGQWVSEWCDGTGNDAGHCYAQDGFFAKQVQKACHERNWKRTQAALRFGSDGIFHLMDEMLERYGDSCRNAKTAQAKLDGRFRMFGAGEMTDMTVAHGLNKALHKHAEIPHVWGYTHAIELAGLIDAPNYMLRLSVDPSADLDRAKRAHELSGHALAIAADDVEEAQRISVEVTGKKAVPCPATGGRRLEGTMDACGKCTLCWNPKMRNRSVIFNSH